VLGYPPSEKIRMRAEVIEKSGNGGRGMSFAKAVDRVLRDHPELYAEYRNS
jgi:hypothetical protein